MNSHLNTADPPPLLVTHKLYFFSPWLSFSVVQLTYTWFILSQFLCYFFSLSLKEPPCPSHTRLLVVTSLFLSFSPSSCFSHTQISSLVVMSLPPPSDPPSSTHKHKLSVAASLCVCVSFIHRHAHCQAGLSHSLSSLYPSVPVYLTCLPPSFLSTDPFSL